MPILRLKEINDMSPEDRTKKITELKTELARLRTMIKAGGAVENPTRIRELRRTIAQILTIANQKKKELPKKEAKAEKKTAKEKKTKE